MSDAERLNTRNLFQQTSHYLFFDLKDRMTMRSLSLMRGFFGLLNRLSMVVYHREDP